MQELDVFKKYEVETARFKPAVSEYAIESSGCGESLPSLPSGYGTESSGCGECLPPLPKVSSPHAVPIESSGFSGSLARLPQRQENGEFWIGLPDSATATVYSPGTFR